MISMEKRMNYFDMQELSFQDSLEIRGGESVWYWIAYGVGSIIRSSTNNTISPGQKLYSAALG
jgi:hypothetical protein